MIATAVETIVQVHAPAVPRLLERVTAMCPPIMIEAPLAGEVGLQICVGVGLVVQYLVK